MTQKSRWRVIRQIPTPVTADGLSVTITAKYGAAAHCDFISVRHYPKTGILEYGRTII